MIQRNTFHLLAIIFILGIGNRYAYSERWTNLAGTNTIEAQFLGLWGDNVVLQKADGQRLVVKLVQLNADGRLLAEELSEKKNAYRKDRLAEIVAIAREADNSQPLAPQVPFARIPDDASLQQSFDHVKEQMQAGHPEIVWDVLPASFQKDVTDVVHLAANKTEPDAWQPMIELMTNSESLLRDKREFILNHPVLVILSGMSPLPVREVYDPLLGFLTEVADPELWNIEKLRTIDIGETLKEKGPRIGGFLRRIDKISGNAGGMSGDYFTSLKVEQPDDISGTVTHASEAGQVKVAYVRFENRWLPRETVENWDNKIADAKSQIEQWGNGTPNPLAEFALQASIANGVVSQLLATNTQTEFNEALRTIAGQIGPQLAPLIMPRLADVPGLLPDTNSAANPNAAAGSYDTTGYPSSSSSSESSSDPAMQSPSSTDSTVPVP